MNSKFAMNLIKNLLLLIIVLLLAMLLWSSNLIEKRIINIDKKVSALKDTSSPVTQTVVSTPSPVNNAIDETYPNLLTPDPFYTTTLPKLLGKDFRFTPLWRDATISKPTSLALFSPWAEVSNWTQACSGTLGRMHFGIWETLGPDFATRIEERPKADGKGVEYWVFLRDDLYWKPLQQALFPPTIKLAPHFLKSWKVTADDFLFYFQTLMNPFNQETRAVVYRQYFAEIEAFRVIDDRTFVVTWKSKPFPQQDGTVVYKQKYLAKQLTAELQPLASFVFKYYPDGTKIIDEEKDPMGYLENSTFAQQFTEHFAKNYIVSCGPYQFEGMSDESIRFKRNENFFAPFDALKLNLETTFRGNTTSIWNDFKEGKLPTHTLSALEVVEWERFRDSDVYKAQVENGEAIKELEYLSRIYGYIGWNQKRGLFNSKRVRQALTMAVNRQRIIEEILNGQAVEITGTFSKTSPNNNPNISPWPFDPDEAKRILHEEGFVDRNKTGILEKEINGEWTPFKFKITYYVANDAYKSISSYLSTALKEIGIQAEPNGIDIADLTAKMDDKDFDAILMLWQLGAPPEDPKQIWHSSGAFNKGSSNFISFQNKEADKIIEELEYLSNLEERKKLYYRFSEILHEEQPYTFLFTPKIKLLYREYVQNVFIPSSRQDLIPGANVDQPQSSIFWIDRHD